MLSAEESYHTNILSARYGMMDAICTNGHLKPCFLDKLVSIMQAYLTLLGVSSSSIICILLGTNFESNEPPTNQSSGGKN